MKKGLLLAILAMFTSVALVGCGKKADEQPAEDSSSTVATEEQKTDEGKDSEEKNEGQDDQKKDENGQQSSSIDLDEKTLEGESVEGTIYGSGKYRLTNASDRVVVEWVKDTAKNKIEYVFNGDKLSAIKVTSTYENEDQAKSTFDAINKNENATKGLKNLKQEGNTISYEAAEDQWKDIKDYTKDKIFDEQKKTLEELSKVDDIRSDD